MAKHSGGKLADERIAEILVEATSCKDEEAAKRGGISVRTLRNYRARLACDPVLAALFRHKKSLVERDWADAAIKTLRSSLAVLNELVEASRPQPGEKPAAGTIREVAGAIHIVGNLGIAREALTGGHVGDPDYPQGAGAAAAAGRAQGSGAAPVQPVH